MKVLVVGNKDDKEEVKRMVILKYHILLSSNFIVSEKEFEEMNKKHDEILTTIIPMNKQTTIEFCKDWPEPIQEYNNPRNRHERQKLATESRRK